MSRDWERFEEDAEWPAKFAEGDLVIYQSHPIFEPLNGKIRRRRWEHGNRTWAYSVLFEGEHPLGGKGIMAIEEHLKPRKV